MKSFNHRKSQKDTEGFCLEMESEKVHL
ncbi:hypothetical protein LNTAR_00370 [Lentisphaera araneosa HTCC2155]|uniref:Uncharacterized protein n=1 Tax=Lentisphaera araneosa HTCC2155 TaxID=313628 RepID=A6DKB0_9BACT|nr:hypothetical protein LNTAR_00365 [Lentisphaera araneosa HTCC2155]EDM27809.1 hypothetical protein LNTAR_00370 [Lentisphaera araneosa HTCC2155]